MPALFLEHMETYATHGIMTKLLSTYARFSVIGVYHSSVRVMTNCP